MPAAEIGAEPRQRDVDHRDVELHQREAEAAAAWVQPPPPCGDWSGVEGLTAILRRFDMRRTFVRRPQRRSTHPGSRLPALPCDPKRTLCSGMRDHCAGDEVSSTVGFGTGGFGASFFRGATGGGALVGAAGLFRSSDGAVAADAEVLYRRDGEAIDAPYAIHRREKRREQFKGDGQGLRG